jgi:hypothetical protein
MVGFFGKLQFINTIQRIDENNLIKQLIALNV